MYAGFFFASIHLLRAVLPESTHRLAKEQKMYTQENQDQKIKLDKFIANNAEEWDIKNGVRSLLTNLPLYPTFRILRGPRYADIRTNRKGCWRNPRG